MVPMFNEVANAARTVASLADELDGDDLTFEILPVDDGSTDDTWAELERLGHQDPRVRPLRHRRNHGRGRALRSGFAAARGRYVITIDADLSYGPEHVTAIVHLLRNDPELEMVIGSPYMPGGRTEQVPALRLWASVLGNRLLAQTMGQSLHTFTGILRGYRRTALADLDLVSDGKEIHLEIITQAQAMGWSVQEAPAVLRNRRAGKSKFKWRDTTSSHLLYSVSEKPLFFFGIIGTICLLAGAAIALALVAIWQSGTLNPERPLMTVMLLLILAGVQLIALGWLGTQVTDLRRAQIRTQRALRRLAGEKAGADGTRHAPSPADQPPPPASLP